MWSKAKEVLLMGMGTGIAFLGLLAFVEGSNKVGNDLAILGLVGIAIGASGVFAGYQGVTARQ